MIYEVHLTADKKVAGSLARSLPDHVQRVLETPEFKRARIYRCLEQDPERINLSWMIQFEVSSKEALESSFKAQLPAFSLDLSKEFGESLKLTHRIFDQEKLVLPPAPEGGLPMTDFPKLYCPFLRQTFKVDDDQWKKLGRKLQLREPQVYLAVNRINPGYEWVFEDKDTFAVEKLHGTNVKVLLEKGQIQAIQNRKNMVDPLLIAKGQNFIMEALLYSAEKGVLPSEGEHAGEVIGPKLQGNPYKLDRHEWVPFERTIMDLRYRSFDEHERNYENWSAWFKDHLFSRLFTKRASKKGSEEKVFAEGVVFYNLRRKSEKKSWMAKLRRDMFPWYYEGLEIKDFKVEGRDEVEDQNKFD